MRCEISAHWRQFIAITAPTTLRTLEVAAPHEPGQPPRLCAADADTIACTD